jgi:hypothetical protein
MLLEVNKIGPSRNGRNESCLVSLLVDYFGKAVPAYNGMNFVSYW